MCIRDRRIGFAGIKHLLKLFQQLNALLQLVHGFLLAVLVQLAQIARISVRPFVEVCALF